MLRNTITNYKWDLIYVLFNLKKWNLIYTDYIKLYVKLYVYVHETDFNTKSVKERISNTKLIKKKSIVQNKL